ncbi:metallophosphoesterase [Paenibacillus sp. GYB006]|uniref:metallophosphoesterase n=1 Tax=Paenibacillus sp. GYB006 TaxID=2994394 RepID=UPI002F967188
MEKIILHLSDLHYDINNSKDIDIVLAALKEDIKKQGLKFNYIFFNGDLVNKGNDLESYELAVEKFIKPLLEITGLTVNEFFVVPGNHEVDRGAINQFVDGNLTEKFSDRDILNSFIDKIEEQQQLLVRLNKYHNFVRDIHKENSYLYNRNPLSTTYVFDHHEIKIGLACLNSAWGAYGGDEDFGKILLGERQVDNAIDELKHCDYKIAMIHHPIEWLKDFDRESVYDRLIAGFNLVLTGHIHSQNYREIAFDNHNTIFLKCASIFQGRTINGYSILKLNFTSNELEVLFREYFDGGRRVFGKAERVAEEGKMVFPLEKKKSGSFLEKNIQIKKVLKDKAFPDINNKLLSVASDSMAPKDINDIFVAPILTSRPENSGKANEQIMDDRDIDLEVVLNEKHNVLFIGKKEMGKTTLLNYICNYYLKKHDILKIPIIIDFNELPKGKNVFQKAISNFLINYDINDFDVNENLVEGNCILLIDNFNLNNEKNLRKLKDFATTFELNRFILTMKEDILQTMKVKDLPDLGFEYKVNYINAFRRGQIRQLVKNWFSFKKIDDDVILENVMTSIKKIGLPRTPMFVSLMLWILEREANFTPVNEASVIENFIETLLEKLNPDESKYETIGFKIKIDFLTFLAKKMIKGDKYYIEKCAFEEIYVSYFNKIGLEVDYDLKQTFFDKGILLKVNEFIYFRFTCFLEYFIALEMNEDKALFNYITDESNYLDFANEIIYYTGLNQKTKSYDILKLVEKRMLESFEEIDKIVDIDKLSSLPVRELLTNFKDDEKVSEKIESMKLSEDEKDIILDDHITTNDSSGYTKIRSNKIKEDFIYNLMLYSNVLRNCELVEIDFKLNALKVSVEKYCVLIGLLYKVLYELVAKGIEEGKEIDNDDDLMYMITIGVPLAMQTIVLKDLGSPKLKVVISRLIDQVETDFERLILTCLYGDLRLEGYIAKYQTLFRTTRSSLIKEIIKSKLFYYQTFFTMPRLEQEQLVNLLSDIMSSEKGKVKNPHVKGRIKQELLKRDLLNKHKKIIE